MNKEIYKKHLNEITDWDQKKYEDLVSPHLNEEQVKIITNPSTHYEERNDFLAIHWHPENVPIELVKKRIQTMFPNRLEELIIPTQHNEILSYGEYAGAEVDCYSKDFNRKVQLLFHFGKKKVKEAHVLKGMIEHTRKYRSGQLFNFIETIINPKFIEKFEEAIRNTEAEEEVVTFTKSYTAKLNKLIKKNMAQTSSQAIKNKLLVNYFRSLKNFYDSHFINKAILLLKETKKIVKANFPLDYFYETNEIIEEARSVGAGIIVPHPEQFWPVLLADYDIDGYEVWNPQSREFTEFLINVINKKNSLGKKSDRPLLITMGDDTHLGEKIRPLEEQDQDKASREIGYQPAWQEAEVKKSLVLGGFSLKKIIMEYKSRIAL